MSSDARAKELIDLGDRLFGDKTGFDSLCQEIALNLYPERADFTTTLTLGTDFGAHLMDSFPLLMRRELGNSISAMLRPRDRQWFRTTTLDPDLDSEEEVARYLDHITKTVNSRIYDPHAKFVRATKQADHDYVTFGQAVISVEEAPNRTHLFFRAHHVRDCAWLDNEIGEVDHLHRKDSMTARAMKRRFGERVLDSSILQACEKEPGKMFPLRVVVLPADEYDGYGGAATAEAADRKGIRDPGSPSGRPGLRLPYAIVYIDAAHGKILREGGLIDFPYVVPRWHMISGSPYAFSPAAMTALPDARMAQDLARILIEAGEKMVDPPMIATEEAVREVNIQAGAVTWVDYAYDERLGEALRPLRIEGDMRTGLAMRQDLRDLLNKAFFIDRLGLPNAPGDMTAYETAKRVEEHIRNLLPLFEPIEIEYNVRLLDKAFALLRNMNMFDTDAMPERLSGAAVAWAFESPLQQAQSRLVVSQFGEVLSLVRMAAEAGVKAMPIYVGKALKDAIRGTGAPATWRKSEAEEAAETEQAEAQQALAGAAQEIAAGSAAVEQASNASLALRQAMAPQAGKESAKRPPAAPPGGKP
ncbi:MAG: portal protein, partial [Hyphomicrobiaceae bacterium]